MNKTITIILLFAFSLTANSFTSKERQGKLKTIFELQDSHKGNDKRLIAFLRDKDAFTRARAVEAYGSLQDTTVVKQIFPLLNDKNEEVRTSTAFALGQTISQMSEAGRILNEKIFFEKKLFTTKRMIEEYGKFCTKDGLEKLCSEFQNDSSKTEALLMAIARAGYRNINSSVSTMFALGQIYSSNTKVIQAASYALMRIGATQEVKDALNKITSLAEDKNVYARMNCATLLGKISDAQTILPTLVTLAENDSDWRVRVNGIKSLGKLDIALYQGILFSLIPQLSDSNEHVSLAVLDAIGTIAAGDSLHEEMRKETWNNLITIVENKNGKYSLRQQGSASVVFAKLFGAKVSGYVKPKAKIAETLNAKYIEAQSYIATDDVFQILLDYASSEDALFARTAIDGFQTYFKKAKQNVEQRNQAYEKLIGLLSSSNDIAVLTSVATALEDSLYPHATTVQPLIDCFNKQKYPEGIEVMQQIISTLGSLKSEKATSFLEQQLQHKDRTISNAAANALKELTGKDFSAKITSSTKPTYTDYDWKFLFALKETTRVELVTNKGNIELELYRDKAPFTVMNFLKLAKKNFYNNTFFHRVVSNFVIQGGDPRGDGWGGPSYAIRSEFSTLKYDENGIVGMGSAGKDTEGSQFFITHSPTPHLDGRYTIFGKVVNGIDVVNSILVGDEVVEVKIK